MYSPNKTKNLTSDIRRIDSSKIFSFNRIANDETVEGGGSLTYGLSFNKVNKSTNNDFINFNLSSLLRLKENWIYLKVVQLDKRHLIFLVMLI